MVNIDVSSDIDEAISSVGDFFRSQIPYATSVALNNSIFDVRTEIVDTTWPKAFKVRNPRIASLLFNVKPLSTKRTLMTMLTQNQSLRGGSRDWIENQAHGGTKRGHTGGRVAIPANAEKMRTPTGRIRASLKPTRLKGTKGVFSIQSGAKTLVMKRTSKHIVKVMYAIVPQADIRKRFRFDEDTISTAIRVFPGYWRLAMNTVIAKSRFETK